MGFLQATTVALAAVGAAMAAPSRRAPAALNYAEWSTSGGVTYKVAIPEVDAAPFDIALQIVAPKATGWAGIGWGGSMLNNPLTVAWPNGDTVTVSARMATGYMMPRPMDGIEYVLGPETAVNATHWTLDVVCKGCSQWTGGKVDPTSARANLAWAVSGRTPAQPANADSAFGYHDDKGRFTLDLASAQSPTFAEDTAAAE